jgi:histidine triad (HIT) family protein
MADCLFCKIAGGEMTVRVLKRSADAMAFPDINPQAPTHVLVISTRHYPAVRDARGAEGEQVLGRLLAFAAEMAAELGLDAGGYRIVANTGPDAGQSVDHLHLHLLGGRKMTWPPG